MDTKDLYSQSRRAAQWAVIISLTLGVAKFFGGWLGNSVALLSDAVHSFGDAFASGSVLAALHWAQRPADTEHPYGHTRIEAVAGSNVSLLLILSALGVGWQALATLNELSAPPEGYTLWIAAASVILNETLFRYASRVAQRTGSTAILATSWDSRLDAFGSLAVFVGLALAHWGGETFHRADHIAALIVAGVILWAGGSLFWHSLQELMDRQAPSEMLDKVRTEAQAVPGVTGVEKLLVRKTGLEFLIDIHIEVDPDITVREGHAVSHLVKDRLMERIMAVKDVLVHIEPAPAKIS